ncbi:MAG TPA: zinc ribbon domain-containing protein [Bryobacteraceae bacterium]|nr:zinc ribbon domain-containing protein [Bryobacteraceae bacterium]
MPEFCTCGAKLPEDARFCHKCGKPQREEPLIVEDEPAPQPPPPVPVAQAPQFPPIGFHNRIAVRTALLTGVLSFFMSVISGQVLPAALLLWLVGAGFLAVFLYRRRTGQRLSMLSGAHLGWLSGVFGFLIMAVLLTFVIVVLSDPSRLESMRQQLQMTAKQQSQVDQMVALLRNPAAVITGLIGTFLLFTLLPAFGGALGAKFLDKD